MSLHIRNALFKLPLFPDPPASVHLEPVVTDGASFSTGQQPASARQSGHPDADTQTNLAGICHFSNASAYPHRPRPPIGYAIDLRIAEFELDCRALDTKFDVMFSMSPINIVIPEPPAFGSGSSGFQQPGAFGWSVPASAPSTTIDPAVDDGPASRFFRGETMSGSMPFSHPTPLRSDAGAAGVKLLRSLQLSSLELHLQSLACRCACANPNLFRN